jgi:hypothetical protein
MRSRVFEAPPFMASGLRPIGVAPASFYDLQAILSPVDEARCIKLFGVRGGGRRGSQR